MAAKTVLRATATFTCAVTAFVADELHTNYLQAKAIDCIKANKFAIHLFNRSIHHPNHYQKEYAYPIGGHYYEFGQRAAASEQADLVVISPFDGLYLTPCHQGTKVVTTNHPVSCQNPDTWKYLFNRVEVLNPNEKTKPITDYLTKTMRREPHYRCGQSAIELSEASRITDNLN